MTDAKQLMRMAGGGRFDAEIETLKAENKRLRAALNKICEATTSPEGWDWVYSRSGMAEIARKALAND